MDLSARYFFPGEFNNYDKMDKQFLQFIGIVRELLNIPMIVRGHSDYRPGSKGMHGIGRAIDYHLKCTSGLYVQAQLMLDALVQTGRSFRLGIYPWWNNPGFHLDDGEKVTFWISTSEGVYDYFSDAREFLSELKQSLSA